MATRIWEKKRECCAAAVLPYDQEKQVASVPKEEEKTKSFSEV